VTPALARTAPLAEEEERLCPLDLEHVYREHALTVARWACRLGGPQVDAEDVVHDVFLKVRRELPRFRGDGKLTTWLYRMTLNEVRHRRRRERWRRWLGGLVPQAAAEMPSLDRAAPELLQRREDVAHLYRALEGLSERYRQVLILFEMEDRSGEEVAELLGARVETVWVWLHRARAQLAARVLDLEGDGP
jgi:RNA polymerase sigma-70 factor (ECF subfamily)